MSAHPSPTSALRRAMLAAIVLSASFLVATPRPVSAVADANLVPLQPARLLDTRSCSACSTVDGQFAGNGRIAAGGRLTLAVAGRGGVDADAAAVMLNVTAIAPSGAGFLTVFPCTTGVPQASNVNYFASEVRSNAVLAKLSTDGQLCIFSLAATDVVVDVSGYVPPAGAPVPVEPARLVETRPGADNVTVDHVHEHVGRLPAGGIVEFQVWGRGQPGDVVPSGAQAVYLNVTAIFPDAPGFLTVYPCTASVPPVSNVNYQAGSVAPNAVLATVSPGGTVCIFSSAPADVIADVNGYLPPGGNRVAINPARCADTRTVAEGGNTVDGLFLGHGRLAAGETYAVTIAGRCNVAGSASAAYVNVTAVNPSVAGFLTVWPCDQPRPGASNVNYAPGAVQPNSVLAKISLDGQGQICIYSLAETHVIVDANGYVPAAGLAGIVELGIGSAYSCSRHADGVVRCVGTYDSIGTGPHDLGASANPAPVIGVANAVELDVGNNHSCAVLADGTARCWGFNLRGQLGDGTVLGDAGYPYTARQTPVQPPVSGAVDVAVGGGWEGFTCAITDAADVDTLSDDVQCWGDNYFGQLGSDPSMMPPNQRFSTAPVVVAGLSGVPVDIEAGDAGACVRMSNGSVWCWGQVLMASPTPVQVAFGGGTAIDLDVGYRHACLVKSGGEVRCWGAGTTGQLGDGSATNSNAPVVAAIAGATSVSVAVDSTCVTLAGGGASCWGLNIHGQVGSGTSTPFEASPTTVSVVPGPFAGIVTGARSACVVLPDTTARCWGYNLAGQLGVKVTGDSAGPVTWGGGDLT